MEHTGTLGDRISQAMKRRGLKNPEVAESLGVHVVTVSKWRSDKQLPDEDTLTALAKALQVTPGWLRYGESLAVREPRPRTGYATPNVEVRGALESGDLLRMPALYSRDAFALLEQMEAAGISRDAQDKIEAFLTHLGHGILTPGYQIPASSQEEEARDAVAFVRRLYSRRGVAIPVEYPPLTEDPDATSGAELERRLSAKKGGKRAG